MRELSNVLFMISSNICFFAFFPQLKVSVSLILAETVGCARKTLTTTSARVQLDLWEKTANVSDLMLL